jgi:hypothetical protein
MLLQDNIYGNKLEENKAWYSGDIDIIADYYQSQVSKYNFYWAKQRMDLNRSVVHLPIANDIATTSSSLLFSKPLKLYNDYTEKEIEYDKVLESVLLQNNFDSLLCEAGEVCSAFGGVFLKLDYDQRYAKHVIISKLLPNDVLAYFHRSWLYAVDVCTEIKSTETTFWRLIERRESIGTLQAPRTRISYILYEGTSYSLGNPIPFSELPEMESYQIADGEINAPLGIVYIPNKKPNILLPNSEYGNSDYSIIYGLMDSLDESWTSWMRDIRLGGGRLFIDEALLDSTKNFDLLQEMYMKVPLADQQIAGEKYEPINKVQFEIRQMEHYNTCESLCKEIIMRAGYSPQTYGYDMKTYTESGSAQRIKEKKSISTTQTKQGYWRTGLNNLFINLQAWEKELVKETITNIPSIKFGDTLDVDIAVKSETLRNLSQAYAISTDQKVALLHPDWTFAEVRSESEKILKEIQSGMKTNMSLAGEKIKGGSDVTRESGSDSRNDTE